MARKFGPDWRRLDAPDEGAETPRAAGLECPECGCRHFETIKSEPRTWGILRRKTCRHCGRRVTTRERLVPDSGNLSQENLPESPK
jgi:hypothetical protein